jgi:sulfate adenylyltransferase subunit 1 (EFTu-like GTPase family)
MTSRVAIRVEAQTDVMQVPVQAVVQRSDNHDCIIRESPGKLALRTLLVGSTNDIVIVIKEGLSATDDVVMNPRAQLATVGLKDEVTTKMKDEPGSDAPTTED